MSLKKKDQAKRPVVDDNGVKNPAGIAITGFSVTYIAMIPLTSWLASLQVVGGLVRMAVKLVPSATGDPERIIPALSALYIFWAFGASGAISVAGQAMSRAEGLDNDHPRKHINNMTGLPLRLRSAHYGLIEHFGGFALAAALAQTLAPRNPQIINLVGLHVITRLGVYYPSYVFNIAPVRTFIHFFTTACCIDICWKLAAGAL